MNWEELIKEIFSISNVTLFDFVDNSYYRIVYSNGTEINVFLAEKKSRLVDVVYWNERGRASMDDFGMYFGNGECTSTNVRLLKDILDVPINQGWTEFITFLNGTMIKNEVYYGIGNDIEKLPSHSSSNKYHGCLPLLVSPFKLLYLSLPSSINGTEIIKIEVTPAKTATKSAEN